MNSSFQSSGVAARNTALDIASAKRRFPLRLPEDLHEEIGAQAQSNQRTMNAEILYRLAHTLHLEAEVARLQAMVDSLLGTHSSQEVFHG